ncbi:MAG: type II toxin-antitoxin system Phd/YefM family antitoxin [Bryobacteraceae bacterium]
MAITILSSRPFNRDTSGAKKAAKDGPVFITDGGKPRHVPLNIEEYRRLTCSHQKIADLLTMPSIEGIELEIPHPRDLSRPADLF